MDGVTVILPAGFPGVGAWQREAVLRPMTGADEAFWLQLGDPMPAAVRATALLTRMLVRLGPLAPVTAAAVRDLTAGDREALLLHLRRLTLGERLPCVANCPACGEPMDMELAVADLLVPPYGRQETEHQRVIRAGGALWRVWLRVPTGADQEAVAQLAPAAAAAAGLLRRCLIRLEPAGGGPPPDPDQWPPDLADAVSRELEDLDPQADLRLDLTCPACGQAATVPFDTGQFFAAELSRRARYLYREIHILALHYHWSEADILALPPDRRHLYLELIGEATARGEGRRWQIS